MRRLGILLLLWSMAATAVVHERETEAVALYQRALAAYQQGALAQAATLARQALTLVDSADGELVVETRVVHGRTGSGMFIRTYSQAVPIREPYAARGLLAAIQEQQAAQRSDQERQLKTQQPPRLQLDPQLLDEDGDGYWSAGEGGTLLVRLANHGGAVAHQVRVRLRARDAGVQLPLAEATVARLEANGEHSLSFALSLPHDYPERTLAIELFADELDGYAADSVAVVSDVAAYLPPELTLKAVGGVEAVVAGVSRTIDYELINRGLGTARHLRLAIAPVDPARVKLVEPLNTAYIPWLKPGDSQRLQFTITPDALLPEQSALPLVLQLSSSATPVAPLPLALNVTHAARPRELLAGGATLPASRFTPEPLQPAMARDPASDTYALIIANRRYHHATIPPVLFAADDGDAMSAVLQQSLGVPAAQIIRHDDLTLAGFNSLFGGPHGEGKLHQRLAAHQRQQGQRPQLILFISGHGAPAPNAQWAPYLLMADSNPAQMAQTAISMDQLYQSLARLPARHVSVYLDACFSGRSPGGLLFANVSPLTLQSTPLPALPPGIDLFAAAGQDQLANWLPVARQGLFTYALSRGLAGKADLSGDKALTNAELARYLRLTMATTLAHIDGQPQAPFITLSAERLITNYR